MATGKEGGRFRRREPTTVIKTLVDLLDFGFAIR